MEQKNKEINRYPEMVEEIAHIFRRKDLKLSYTRSIVMALDAYLTYKEAEDSFNGPSPE